MQIVFTTISININSINSININSICMTRNLAFKIKNICEAHLFMLEQNVFIV